MGGPRVLVVDDDPQILHVVRTSLETQGFQVSIAPNGEAALDLITRTSIELVILGLGLPGIGGEEVITRLRSWSNVPVIALSVRDDPSDKVAALEAGADDYLTKPFAIEELLARMRAVRRRISPQPEQPMLRFDELEIDLARRHVTLGGDPVRLTPTEYELLQSMAVNPGRLLTHRWLLDKVWGPAYANETHLVRVFVQQLRQKLGDDASQPKWIVTETGIGYRWKPQGS